ncbi:hypothetical protein WICPIJ_001084 [Wickerhamomyces pijperi]|uniref:Anaphase-promoting complex subunit 4 WD40 domain-containing protein n=1 Tax=Wickerhamomyces pijperi TaxID=599730 RepID=A0A9P8QCC1_WICPI|nr:hypothetical protein WICPIJ_001084 [Wickerhamomyces pijperi]
MNISLLDPFAALKDFPETLTRTISQPNSYSVYVKYNEQGNYLACGLSSGTILLIDNDTKQPIRILSRHTKPIQSLTWSRCGRYLLSSSRDWRVYLWDVITGGNLQGFNFHTPVWTAEFNPVNEKEFIVALFDEMPLLVDSQGAKHIIPTDINNGTAISVLKFHPNGQYIFTGSNKGVLTVIQRVPEDGSLRIVGEVKVSSSAIRNIIISPNGLKIATNSSDRIIRQYNIPSDATLDDPQTWQALEITHKYQDIVNRIQWNSIMFHPTENSEYLIASAYGSSHVIYMWETTTGSMLNILQGPEEELMDLDWNVVKCTICATGVDTGNVYLWSLVIPQRWSALAPDFVEIDENIEYQEQEDEFDFKGDEQEGRESERKRLREEAEIVIDVWTKEKRDARGNPLELGVIVPVDYSLDIAEL